MRYASLSQTAVNGVTNSAQAAPTPDDNSLRTLKVIWCPPATAAGLLLTLRRAGFQLAQVDSLRFAAGNHPLPINEAYQATIQFSIDFANNSGGTVTGFQILLGYELGDTSSQPISNSVI
jgi:hypothetical protein